MYIILCNYRAVFMYTYGLFVSNKLIIILLHQAPITFVWTSIQDKLFLWLFIVNVNQPIVL